MSFLWPVHFCSHCGGKTTSAIPEGEDRLRAVCTACGMVHYQNPRLVNCLLATDKDGRILLARRNIEPRKDYWTLPGGFMELYESVPDAAMREFNEETHCQATIGQLIALISLPDIGQVHCFFRAHLTHFSAETTIESNAVACFAEDAIPWEDLAFFTVRTAIQHYLSGATHVLVASLDRDRNLTVQSLGHAEKFTSGRQT